MSDATPTEEPISAAEFDAALADVIGSLMDRADEERRAGEPWKRLWEASEGGLEGLLNDAEYQASRILGDALDVIKARFEIGRVSPRLRELIRALPFAMRGLKDGISAEHGFTCSSDKARFVYAREVLAEINRIREAEAKP